MYMRFPLFINKIITSTESHLITTHKQITNWSQKWLCTIELMEEKKFKIIN